MSLDSKNEMILYNGKLFGKQNAFLYIREKASNFGLIFVGLTIFIITLMLSGITFHDLWYPTIINVCFIALYVAVDYYKYVSRHNELWKLKKNIDVTVDSLPEPDSLLEKDYQMLLRELKKQKNEAINVISSSRKDMTEYVTIWTHQVKTPLTALQFMASDIEEPNKSEIMARLFEIEQYGDMMLQYLRLDSQNTDYVLQEYKLKSIVNQAVKYHARSFISKGIAVKIDVAENCSVVTDEKWMVFVLKQLVSNAIKYTEKGCVSVYVKDDKLIIEDTGIGIANEDLPRIFEKGFTGYNGRKDKKATGLGLFLVGTILHRLNHSVTIESEVNEGTRVSIEF